MSRYVTLLTVPLASYTVLMRTPFCEAEMLLFSMMTPLTVLSERPPTEPMLRPWPPEQVPPMKWMLVPELMARQSSWFLTLALEMVIPLELPTSNASVLWPPPESPAELSMVMWSRVRSVALLMLKPWTGVFLTLSPVMLDCLRECA